MPGLKLQWGDCDVNLSIHVTSATAAFSSDLRLCNTDHAFSPCSALLLAVFSQYVKHTGIIYTSHGPEITWPRVSPPAL